MKKLVVGISVAAVWATCVTLFGVYGTKSNKSDSQFTVLTVKEDAVKNYNTMPVFQDLAQETGIDVNWIFNTSAQYSNNTDPVGTKGIDAIYHTGFSNLKLAQYGKRNRIVKIDEHLDAMPNFKRILNSRPDIKEAIKSPDGHIYSLPRVEEMGLKQFPNILYLNRAWVQALIDKGVLDQSIVDAINESGGLKDGLRLKRSQFHDILVKFNEYDKQGNPKANSGTPLNFVFNNWQGNEADLIASYGVPENRTHKTIVDKKVIFTFQDEKWFNAIKDIAKWNSEEIIRSSAFTQTESDFLAKGQDGTYGAFYWWEKKTVVAEQYHDDYIVMQPLVDDETGKQYVGVSNELEIEKGECVILESCQDKDTLLSYFDKFFEPKYSAQLNYGSIKSGAFKPTKVNGKLVPNDVHEGGQSADDFRMKNAPYGVVYLTKETWDNSVEMESRAKLRLEDLENYVAPYKFEGAEGIPNLNYTSEELETLNIYEASLGKNVSGWITNAITGGSTVTLESWKNLLEINKNSIEKVLEVNQNAYDRYRSATNK